MITESRFLCSVHKTNNCPHFFCHPYFLSWWIFLSKYIVLYALRQPIEYLTFKFTFFAILIFSQVDISIKIHSIVCIKTAYRVSDI